jgi:UDPglucose 6-dehydrogenase
MEERYDESIQCYGGLKMITVIGLGKLGMCLASVLASKNYKVIGYDNNQYTINGLNDKKLPIVEAGLNELTNNCWQNLKFVHEDGLNESIKTSDVIFIIVPTPSDEDGKFSNKYITDILERTAIRLSEKSEFTTIVITSTIMPGSCTDEFIPLLEELSGKKNGVDFGLVYNPTFIAIGSVINDLLKPGVILIGSADQKSMQVVCDVHKTICENQPHIATMNHINAEISKLTLNCYITSKISFVNELSMICEKVDGSDASIITKAIGADKRVGNGCFGVGLGFGGPCFPRDNAAFRHFALRYGCRPLINEVTPIVNDNVVGRVIKLITGNIQSGIVAVFGLSYKPGTYLVDCSQSIDIINKLLDKGYKIRVHDPAAIDAARLILKDRVEYHSDQYSCALGVNVILILVNWDEYKDLNWEEIGNKSSNGAILFDAWRQLDGKNIGKLRYIGFGRK